MTYAQARAQLRRWTVQAVRPGLDRTRRLLAALGNPDAALPAIQITGTNGKGSVAALIDGALRAAGYRTGRFTSPHLEDERERIVINGAMLSRAALIAAVAALLPHLKKLHAQKTPATAFEAWTVMAALAFHRARVQVAVLEVGMGGRLDATTAWKNIIASVLTHVGLDHTRELGKTLPAIAREKAAIARPQVPFFAAENKPALLALIRRHCRSQGTPLLEVGSAPGSGARVLAWARRARGISLDLAVGRETFRGLRVGLRGEHQTLNAALAALVCRHLAQTGFTVGPAALRQGFQNVVWPGRLEKVSQHPAVFLDGAHNPDAAGVLAREMQATAGPFFLVMGVMADKDVRNMVRVLAPQVLRAWTVKPPDARGLAAASLAGLWANQGVSASAEASIGSALGKALRAAGKRGTVVVAGSLYILAPARRYLKKRAAPWSPSRNTP